MNEPSMTISLEGYKGDQILDQIVEHIVAKFGEDIDSKVRSLIEERIDSKLSDLVDGKLSAMVDTVLDEGWRERDKWGGSGKLVTFRDRVSELLFNVTGDSYNRKSLVDNVVDSAFQRLWNKELREQLDEAKAIFREQVDESLSAGFKDELRKALGVRA